MKYAEVISKLYGTNFYSIIQILNNTIYSKDCEFSKDNVYIHTGFAFINHKNKKFELIYNIHTEEIYRQPRELNDNLPQMNGIFVFKDNSDFFNSFSNDVALEISETDNIDGESYLIKDFEKYLTEQIIEKIDVKKTENDAYKEVFSFKVLDKEKNIKAEFPFQKTLLIKLFYNGRNDKFERYISDEEYWNNE